MSEDIKKVLEEQRFEYQRYLGVLKEDFDAKLDTVAEGVVSLDQKIDRLETELKRYIRSEITALRAEIKELYEKKADLSRVEALEQRVAAVERLIGKQGV